MKFYKHLDLVGKHALLGASQYHWLNYDSERIKQRYVSYYAKLRGTELHEFAAQCIHLGQKLSGSRKTLNRYVNDAIGFGMSPEVTLFYSENCFGTTDAICFRDDILRIHDLKTGNEPASMWQLRIYAALFCLEYRIKPEKIRMVLRIYQNDEIKEEEADPAEIRSIMNKIIDDDKIISNLKAKEE